MTAYELKLQELNAHHDCDICGRPNARPVDGISIVDGSPIVTWYCAHCQAEIDEANAEYQPKPATNWKQFFGV